MHAYLLAGNLVVSSATLAVVARVAFFLGSMEARLKSIEEWRKLVESRANF